MYKYIWILMLSVPLVSFVGYSIYIIISAIHDEEVDDLESFFDYMDCWHESMLKAWIFIIFFALILLFVTSGIDFMNYMSEGS